MVNRHFIYLVLSVSGSPISGISPLGKQVERLCFLINIFLVSDEDRSNTHCDCSNWLNFLSRTSSIAVRYL
jgi:hypothetical protein